MARKKVLVLSYVFPPLGGPGSQRTAKFVKFLPQFGFTPVVVAAEHSPYLSSDASLLETCGRTGAEVIRLRWNILPGRFAHGPWANLRRRILPDEDIDLGWLPLLRTAVDRLIHDNDFSIVYSSCSPFWINLEGYRIKKKYGIPWVTDFRDPWISNPEYVPRTIIHHFMRRIAERLALRECDHFVANTDSYLERERAKYPFLKEKSSVIPNGYDPDDFKPYRRTRDPRWRLTYAGDVYGDYNPFHVLARIKDFVESEGIPPPRLRYAGPAGERFRRIASEVGFPSQAEDLGYMSHEQCVRLMMDSDLLLFFVPNKPRAAGWVPAKIYEYMGSRTPLFGVAPQGDAKKIVERARAGAVVTHDENGFAIRPKLRRLRNARLRRSSGLKSDMEFIRTFDRRETTRKLATLFNLLTAS